MIQNIRLRVSGGEAHALQLVGAEAHRLQLERVRVIYEGDRPAYTGPYTVTPGRQAVTLATDGKRMTDDVVVGAIPPNYGLITWDGHALTVS